MEVAARHVKPVPALNKATPTANIVRFIRIIILVVISKIDP
jgi:hypothetical protein